MKKLFIFILIINIIFMYEYPCFAMKSDKTKVCRVSKFNKAIKKGDIETLKECIDNDFNINQTYYGTSFFIDAINKKQDKSIDFLINNNADVNIDSILPPLYYSVVKRYPYATQKLLEAGANQDKMYMGVTAEKVAIAQKYTEIIDIFNKYNNSQFKNTTNLEEAFGLLKENPITKPFWLILNGENPKNKPFIIKYSHMSLFYDKEIYQNVLASLRVDDDNYYILINENLKNSSKEALATLIASQAFHTDLKDSINEEAYSALTMATVWHSFIVKNPQLIDEESILVRTLNEYELDLFGNNCDLVKFKNKIADNPTYKKLNLPTESPGFTNDLLNLPEDKNIYGKMKSNMKAYWNNTPTSEKVYKVCYFIAYSAMIIGVSYLLNSNINTSVQQSTFTTLRINSFK